MKKKIIVELKDNNVIIASNEIYEHNPTTYLPSNFVKSEITNVTEDNMADIINHIIDNNRYTVFAEFVFKEKELKLEIFSDKVLNNINADFVLQKKKDEQYKMVSNILNSAVTLIDSEPNMYFKDYATVYDILRIHKSLSCFNDIVHHIEKEYTKKLSFRGKNNCVKIDCSEYLEGKEKYIKLTIGQYPYYVTKDFVRINTIGYGNEIFSNAKLTLDKEWKRLFNILDNGREFFNCEENNIIGILNYNGILHIKKESLVLTDNKTFTINCKYNEESESFSSYYKEFLLLKENSEELLKRSFVKISDCPTYLQENLKILNQIKLEGKNNKVKTK